MQLPLLVRQTEPCRHSSAGRQLTGLLNDWQLRLPQSLACCCSLDKEAASVESVVRLSLLPDHPVADLQL